jgi:TolB protein
MAVFCLTAQAQAIRLQSATGVDSRIAVAVPEFPASEGQHEMAVMVSSVLASDLEFSGLIQVVPRTAFPASFTGLTQDAAALDFDAWRKTTAEFVVHGVLYEQAGALVAECRLLDVTAGTMVVGKRLSASREFPRPERLLAHQFADEIIRFLSGTPGVATSEICYSNGVSGSKEIYVADYDGGHVTQLTKHGAISITPRMSPDGQKVCYVSYKDRYPWLYIYDRKSGESTVFSKHVGLNSAPAWSPDGSKLAYVLSKDGNTEIYIKNADGTGQQRLTNSKSADSSPTFSPDGSRIAFVSERDGRPQVYVMSVSGDNPVRISRQGGNAFSPQWSPDGKSIACVVERGGLNIYVMDVNGGNARALTAQGNNESPSWSPDSRHIIYTTSRRGRAELWTVTVETGEQRPVPQVNTQRAEAPSWGPRRN